MSNIGITEFRAGAHMVSLGGTFEVHSGGGAAGNGLLNNLIAYWPGNEAAGNALDLHVNALHLTDVSTVTSNPGLVYPLARQYTRVNSEYHTRPGDDALLSVQDIDFTLATWCYLDSKGANYTVAGKYEPSIGQRAYASTYNLAADRWRFAVSPNGAVLTTVFANSLGVPALSTWYLVVAWHDSVANTINIQVNNGGVDSQAHLTGVFDNTAAFAIGANADIPAWRDYFDGRIGPTMFWKSNAGLGGVLTAAQRTALFNGGAGLTYADFTT